MESTAVCMSRKQRLLIIHILFQQCIAEWECPNCFWQEYEVQQSLCCPDNVTVLVFEPPKNKRAE